MGRAPCCDKANVKRGPWSPEEDSALKNYVEKHGTGGNWIALPQKAGLKRCGKSCRLRWLNYLRPDIKHGGFTEEEDDIICSLYKSIGSRWSVIASKMKGRTDNDVKNYWNTKLKKKFMAEQTSYPNKNKNKNNRNYTTSLVTNPKVDNFGYSNYLNSNSISTLSLPIHTSFQEDYNTQQRFVSDTTSEYQFPLLSRIMEDNSELISSTNSLVSSRTTTISSSQEVVSVLDPIQSSSLYLPNFENNYSNYESFDQDGLLMDYGLSYGDDLLQDFGFYHQEKTNSEASAVTAASSSAANNIYDYFRACKTSSITNY